jgi:hypothetical protein
VKLKNIYNFIVYSIIMKFYEGWRKTLEEIEKKKKKWMSAVNLGKHVVPPYRECRDVTSVVSKGNVFF